MSRKWTEPQDHIERPYLRVVYSDSRPDYLAWALNIAIVGFMVLSIVLFVVVAA